MRKVELESQRAFCLDRDEQGYPKVMADETGTLRYMYKEEGGLDMKSTVDLRVGHTVVSHEVSQVTSLDEQRIAHNQQLRDAARARNKAWNEAFIAEKRAVVGLE